ncbi:GNAT family N-acetyltransferase [Anaerocolumna sp. MB42-C2]|uniref:GNAT family N-acetyltransferase n=1 Tax=Anaerocolumna sp. MB42-C2 TaxID=3070997 RepID=UPI0027E18E97|nr:GNAT family N-acetyltransferase [Anaerocolumna sp. MB42-C2]WMJ87161.1 GNAT family N-acetyltransferase [Anaerocolumna sp. MB42-C2]
MKIRFERANIEDAETLIDIRNLCFYKDYLKYGVCPGYNITKEQMRNSIIHRISYKIICGNQIVGNISVKDNKDNTYYLSCLCVIPDYENKGIGQSAIHFIEQEFPDASSWTLETPADKVRNHYFYKKMGYNLVKEIDEGPVKLVVFEKIIKNEEDI